MSSNHGKQYKNKIEAMTNKKIEKLNNDLIDLSTNTFDMINKLNDLIDVPLIKTALFNQRNNMKNNDDDIYTGNVFKDVCGNFFRVNDKGVIKQYDSPSNYVINTLYKKNPNKDYFIDKNFTDLKTYDEFIVDDNYNFIKGTNIGAQGVKDEAHEGSYVFSNKLINDYKNRNNGNCYTLKSGQTFSSEATYFNVSSPFECKQLATNNFYKNFILQKDVNGSLNCYLSNNDDILNLYDLSKNACNNSSLFKSGLSVNNSYGIYNNNQVGNKNNYLQGGYIDFDSNFVRNNEDLSIDNSKTYTIHGQKTAPLGDKVSCKILKNDNTVIGYVKKRYKNKCYFANNDVLMDPTQRVNDKGYNIIIKNKKYVQADVVEPFNTITTDSVKLSKYEEVDYPTFTLEDILNKISQNVPEAKDDIIAGTNIIKEKYQNIYQELEKYNMIIREANLKLPRNISLNMDYVGKIENYFDTSLNINPNLENIQELKRKLEDEKLVLNYNHNNYILWTLLGVTSLAILLKVSKPSSN